MDNSSKLSGISLTNDKILKKIFLMKYLRFKDKRFCYSEMVNKKSKNIIRDE